MVNRRAALRLLGRGTAAVRHRWSWGDRPRCSA